MIIVCSYISFITYSLLILLMLLIILKYTNNNMIKSFQKVQLNLIKPHGKEQSDKY